MSNSGELMARAIVGNAGHFVDTFRISGEGKPTVLVVGDRPSKTVLATIAGVLGAVGMTPLLSDITPKPPHQPMRHERHQGRRERERRLKK